MDPNSVPSKKRGWFCRLWLLCGNFCYCVPCVPSSPPFKSQGSESNGPFLCGPSRARRNDQVLAEQELDRFCVPLAGRVGRARWTPMGKRRCWDANRVCVVFHFFLAGGGWTKSREWAVRSLCDCRGLLLRLLRNCFFVWPLFVRICPGFNSESRKTYIYIYLYI